MENGKPTRYAGVYRMSNGRLFVRVTARIDGVRTNRRQVLPEGATEAEAIALVARLKGELEGEQEVAVEAKLPVSQQTSRQLPTFSAYVESWMRTKRDRLRSAVSHEWAHRLGQHILPVKVDGERDLGALPLDQINRMTLERWVGWAERARQPPAKGQTEGKPYSPDTVSGWWRVLTQVIRDAAADYDLPDPTRRVNAPRLGHVEKVRTSETLDAQQVDDLMEKAKVVCADRAAEVAFLAMTGCRSGEMYGLHWPDVDLDGAVVKLRYSATRGELQPTKTSTPRSVPLRPKLVEILRDHQARQQSGKRPVSKDGLVFPNELGGYRLEQSLAKPFDALSITIGQKVTPQVLRRSLNTNLLAAGVDPITIQSILGHTTDAMTARYAGISVQQKARALDAMP